jgi:chitinase
MRYFNRPMLLAFALVCMVLIGCLSFNNAVLNSMPATSAPQSQVNNAVSSSMPAAASAPQPQVCGFARRGTLDNGCSNGSTAPPTSGLELVGFWQSWSDTTLALSSVPSTVTMTDVAFSTAVTNNTLAAAQNTTPLTSGAAAIHAHGGKVLISFGGSTGTGAYASLNPSTFAQSLAGFFAANPGVYDGIDFDDEQDPRNAQTLIKVIQATRAALPNIIITYDAFASGADAGTGAQAARSDWQGSDIPVAAAVAQSINWVNVMDYDLSSWKPSTNMSCTTSPGTSNDCYKDVIAEFAKIYPANKIVMGLMVPQDDGGAPMSAANVGAYAQWVKSSGYRGIMIWDLNRDTGFSAVKAAATALGS